MLAYASPPLRGSSGSRYKRCPATRHTSFCDFGKGQTGAALQINVFGKDQRAQGSEWFAREEVGLAALHTGVKTRSASKHNKEEGNDGQQHRTSSFPSKPWMDARFRDTGAGRRLPLARYRRGQARRGHRGLALETRNPPLAKGDEKQVWRQTHLRSMSSGKYPWRQRLGFLIDCRAGGRRGWREERRWAEIGVLGGFFVDAAAAVLIRRW